jgi:hypothetical protein
MSTEHKDEPRSVTGLFAALAVAALLVLGFGYWWHGHQARAVHVPMAATQSVPGESPFVKPSSPSDEQLVAIAVRDQLTKGAVMPKSGSKLILCRMQLGYAAVTYVPSDGVASTYVVKQTGGDWKVAWTGPSVTAAVAAANALPADYTKACAASALLYTF